MRCGAEGKLLARAAGFLITLGKGLDKETKLTLR
jgi:hypothetical protein